MSLFDVNNTHPVAQIVSRRHPLGFAAYVMTLILGLIFVFHWYGVSRSEADLFPGIPWFVIFAWKWEMVTGGGVALAALCMRPRLHPHWPDLADLLHLEGIGALVAAFGLSTYIVALIDLSAKSHNLVNLGPALAVYLPLVGGRVWRGVQALRESRLLEGLVSEIKDDKEAHE